MAEIGLDEVAILDECAPEKLLAFWHAGEIHSDEQWWIEELERLRGICGGGQSGGGTGGPLGAEGGKATWATGDSSSATATSQGQGSGSGGGTGIISPPPVITTTTLPPPPTAVPGPIAGDGFAGLILIAVLLAWALNKVGNRPLTMGR